MILRLHFVIFDAMETIAALELAVETLTLPSKHLKRAVDLSFYLPKNVAQPATMSLLLINDGQDLATMAFDQMLHQLYVDNIIQPILVAAISAGADRTQEYGVAKKKDYLGRGAKAGAYTKFIIRELIPFIQKNYRVPQFKETAIAGFSLGVLSALDIALAQAGTISKVGVFSGALWWRSRDQSDKKYDDHKHRIMQQQIRKMPYHPNLKFFFECGAQDESGDRNNNGVIDSIDDTRDHIQALFAKGYTPQDITYLELEDGRHDVATWARALPVFLKWGWGTAAQT